MPKEAGIARFWRWWPGARPRLERAIEEGFSEALTEEVAAQVRAIHPELDWEVAPGSGGRHAFNLSANGDGALRALGERWARAAPEVEGWEFHPSRPPRPETPFALGGEEIDPARGAARFEVDELRERIDVEIHHPAFARLDEDERGTAAVLLLYAALGEDAVDRWIGAIEAPRRKPAEAKPLAALPAAVKRLERRATGERFAVLEAEGREGRVVATINMALKRLDALDFGEHLAVEIPLRAPTEEGLTTDAEADELEELELGLRERLGEAAVYAGRETGRGRRRIHFFAAEGGPAAPAARAFAAEHKGRKVKVHVEPDPGWEALSRWTAA